MDIHLGNFRLVDIRLAALRRSMGFLRTRPGRRRLKLQRLRTMQSHMAEDILREDILPVDMHLVDIHMAGRNRIGDELGPRG